MNPVSFAYEGGMLMGLAYKWMAFGVKKAGSLSCKNSNPVLAEGKGFEPL